MDKPTDPAVGARDETVVPDSLPDEAPPPEVAVAQTQNVKGRVVAPRNLRQAGITTIGDYRIIKKLGAGAMGEVYKAHQNSLDRDVALKVLSKQRSKDKTFVERFFREARVMAKLDHPNIIRSYDVGEFDGWHYLAMEFIDGGTVEDWLKKAGNRFTIGDALRITIECARGLEHAHELKLVHRDIKPGNVLLTSKGGVKVADLGLAKATDEDMSLTQSGVGAGTPYYMSPEQTRNAKHVDGRSDIYALGCMLYLFLCGDHAFKGNTPLELIEAKEKGKFTPARRVNDEVTPRLDLIIDKMLARDPNVRYQTCTELLADLEALELAHKTLSFLSPAPAAKTAPSAVKSVARSPAAAAAPKPAAAEHDPDVWYIKYRDGKKRLKKRMTTAQVKQLIQDPDFDVQAEGSHHSAEGFRLLSSYREFSGVLQGRLAKAKADKKVEKIREMYGELEKVDYRQRRWRGIKRMMGSFMGWVYLTIWCVVIGVGLYVGYRVLLIILEYVGAWGRSVTAP